MRKIHICLLLLAIALASGCARHEVQHFDCANIGISYDGFSDINVKEDDAEFYNVFWDDLGFTVQKIDYEDLDSSMNFMKILNEKTGQIAISKKINIKNQNINEFSTNSLTGIYTTGAGDGKGIFWIFGVAEPSKEDSNYCLFFVISYTEGTQSEASDVILKSLELFKQ